MPGWLHVPRFDTAEAIALNSAFAAITLLAVVLLIRDRRTANPWPWGAFLLLGASMNWDGIFVPIGPLLMLFALWAERGRVNHARATAHAGGADG